MEQHRGLSLSKHVDSITESDIYKILGVRRTASEQEIRTAYNLLCKCYDPEKNTDRGARAEASEADNVTLAQAFDEALEELKKPKRIPLLGLTSPDAVAYDSSRMAAFAGQVMAALKACLILTSLSDGKPVCSNWCQALELEPGGKMDPTRSYICQCNTSTWKSGCSPG